MPSARMVWKVMTAARGACWAACKLAPRRVRTDDGAVQSPSVRLTGAPPRPGLCPACRIEGLAVNGAMTLALSPRPPYHAAVEIEQGFLRTQVFCRHPAGLAAQGADVA